MGKIHIVGEKYSFTYLSAQRRYGSSHKFSMGKTHRQLVDQLLNGKINKRDTAVVPIWNSHSGTINMDQETRTVNMLTGKAGGVVDLWGDRIMFALGVKGLKLLSKYNVYSVRVAEQQCSQFLNKEEIIKEKRFLPADTTTDAYKAFSSRARKGDGILCSRELLDVYKVKIIKYDVANRYNITAFFTFNTLPYLRRNGSNFSLGCIGMNLSGNALPYDFIDYWKGIAQSSVNVHSADIPKIIFVVRYEESKALVLLEMPTHDSSIDPWEMPGSGSSLNSFGQVGIIGTSFNQNIKELLINSFKVKEDRPVFYGTGQKGSYLWSCPSLDISVHGFDPDLVKDCARIQVLHLKNLMNYGVDFPSPAAKILASFESNQKRLKLAADSQPDSP
jgi:prephenate dehydratase